MTKWYISARSNSTLLLTDTAIEQDYEGLTLIKRFNDVGTWTLKLRKESSHLNTFLPVNKGYPNGIYVSVDNEDGNGPQLVLSGPQTDIDVKSQQDQTRPAVVTGTCDNYWLSKRRAFQVPHYPYAYYCTSLSAFLSIIELRWYSAPEYLSLLRFYTLSETSGTTATDAKNAQNGTYTGGYTLNQNPIIDDSHPAALFNGSTGYVSCPASSLPTGTAQWTMACWCMLSSLPSSGNFMMALNYGNTLANGGAPWIGVDSAGNANCGGFGGAGFTATGSGGGFSLNTPHLLVGTYDGTALHVYLDGVLLASKTCTMAAAASALNIGRANSGAYYWNGLIEMAAVYTTALSAATISTMYAIGISRQAYLAYDNPFPLQASATIIYYVLRNAGISAPAGFTNYGGAAPQTSFVTQTLGSRGARQIPNISLATDPALGSTITGLARQDNLLELIAALALMSTTELGFKLEQVGSNLVFSVFQPGDLTSTAIFSRDLYGGYGNILNYEWKLSAATANHIIAGGSNTSGTSLAERIFVEGEDTTSISANGYLEDFLDYRQAQNGATAQQAISAELLKMSNLLNINVTTIDSSSLYFKGPTGKGYDLGNKVTVLVDGQTFQALIREIQIDLQPGQPAVIQPAIGTPLNASIVSEYREMARRLAKIGVTIADLNVNY